MNGSDGGKSAHDHFDGEVAAGFLDSGRTIAGTANAAAILAGAACLIDASRLSRIAFLCSLIIWFVQCWFGIRVRIDASLFGALAGQPLARLDNLLIQWRFRRIPMERSLEDRINGALRLWRRQIVAAAMQCAALLAGILLLFWRM